MQNKQKEQQAVNEVEAARMLGLSVQTMRNQRFLRKGCPYVKLGRSVRYLVADIYDHLMKNRIDPETEALQ